MRAWVEKLSKAIKNEGIYTYLSEIIITNYRIKLEKFREDISLFVSHFKTIDNETYYDKHVSIKLYPDEYDLLHKVITDIEESEKDNIIKTFNSFE